MAEKAEGNTINCIDSPSSKTICPNNAGLGFMDVDEKEADCEEG